MKKLYGYFVSETERAKIETERYQMALKFAGSELNQLTVETCEVEPCDRENDGEHILDGKKSVKEKDVLSYYDDVRCDAKIYYNYNERTVALAVDAFVQRFERYLSSEVWRDRKPAEKVAKRKGKQNE